MRQQTALRLTLGLTRSIGFLELSNVELTQTLHEIASDNPWLMVQAARPAEFNSADAEDDGPSLISHILSQLPHLVPAPRDHAIAIALAEALDANGILTATTDAVARRTGVTRDRVNAVLDALRRIEPRGVFAHSLADCLGLQLAAVGALDAEMQSVLDRLDLLTQGGLEALAAETRLPLSRVASLVARLRELDPRPAARFSSQTSASRVADLTFTETTDGWQVALNPETTPRLSLATLGGSVPRGSRLSQERREANMLIAAIERRNKSMLDVGRVLAREQSGFLSDGVGSLRPLTKRAVALEIGLHESTVGRLVNAGSAATPHGTIPLTRFFSRAARRDPITDEPRFAAPAVGEMIARIVESESAEKPFSDTQIAERLSRHGITVSRRVVSNIRNRAGIDNRATRKRRR
ncbi:hypothetical protein HH303_13200 [Rhodospirillaceae bacterium KN72]|uniref:RNA polymerase sigma-54 factor n=1 Tax=Pacificispira spongiicola TaxID=2729598 RepID=A0A7Y0HHF7_9PROT|nr:hypothetical protein [Pacificispira spongiicola]NMM45444.1 hypothetical protein [Pacificispira spongiicola]